MMGLRLVPLVGAAALVCACSSRSGGAGASHSAGGGGAGASHSAGGGGAQSGAGAGAASSGSGLSAAGGGATIEGASVIGTHQIEQNWTQGTFQPATVSVDTQAGDAIVVLGMYWDATKNFGVTAPSVTPGALLVAVDQGPAVGNADASPPVYTQIHYLLNASASTYVIAPPELGGAEGDGTLYVVQVRGLTDAPSLVATGQTHDTGSGLSDVAVALASPAQAGDLLLAIGGYDNTQQLASAGITDPPAGWQSAGVQDDAAWNVPSEACHRLAPNAGTHAVSWTWADPNVNVVAASMVALR